MITITFKEARAEARSQNGACIGRFKDGGWFVNKGRDERNIFYVEKSGALMPLTEGAKKYLKRRNKSLDKWPWV